MGEAGELCGLGYTKGDPPPCVKFEGGPDGRCTTCRHLEDCHGLVRQDAPWRVQA